jgi:hypothetical protein
MCEWISLLCYGDSALYSVQCIVRPVAIIPIVIPSVEIAKPELRRLARKKNLATSLRQNNATGKSPKTLSSPLQKNIPFNLSGKSVVYFRASHPMRGALRTSRTRGGMRWTRMLRRTSAADAYGESVWS